MTYDNRHLLHPPFYQTVDGWNTGCETNTLVSLAKRTGVLYSRAYTEYFDNLEKKLGSNLERTIKSAMQWGMMTETFWPTIPQNKGIRPPDTVIGLAQNPIAGYIMLRGSEGSSTSFFDYIDFQLSQGNCLGAYLELSDAIKEVGPDGIMQNKDTPHSFRHVVPLWGRVHKNNNDDWYGFRNHAGPGWGDHGDFYIHKSYLRRHLKNLILYLVQFK